MGSFREFMDEIEESPTRSLPDSELTISAIQMSLASATSGLLAPFSLPDDEKQKFSEEVSNLIQDKSFLSELSEQIDEPFENESEDEFIKRSSNSLRRMLYNKFNIKD